MRYYEEYPAYVPVGERRARAEKKLRQLQKKYPHLKPVIVAGQTLANTWWGKSWNNNLERYADYSNRIERGRSYVRHRAVLDLQLTSGKITAMVQGSSPKPYDVVVTVVPLSASHWESIRTACAGGFDSLGELLAGKFPQAFKELFFDKGAGLFPAPRDIHFTCSCPDWASMCKHVAATLYGVGVRLDSDAALFFTLRGINVDDLITRTVTDTAQTLLRKAGRQSQNILQDADLGDVFGIQLDDIDTPRSDTPARPSKTSRTKQQTSKLRHSPPSNTAKKTPTTQRLKPRKTAPALLQAGSASVTARRPSSSGVAASKLPQGTMLDVLVQALGKTRTGKSVAQLQEKLGWTRTQVRNAISRASAKGLLETVTAGMYRVRR